MFSRFLTDEQTDSNRNSEISDKLTTILETGADERRSILLEGMHLCCVVHVSISKGYSFTTLTHVEVQSHGHESRQYSVTIISDAHLFVMLFHEYSCSRRRGAYEIRRQGVLPVCVTLWVSIGRATRETDDLWS